MGEEKIKFLKERAEKFYKNALELFNKGEYNLSAFNLEQALQLYLKYLIAKQTGDWPKTHYLNELVDRLEEAYENSEIKKYKKEKELFFDDLSDAYFTSRYYPKNFSKDLVEKLLEEFNNFINFLEKITNEKFGSN